MPQKEKSPWYEPVHAADVVYVQLVPPQHAPVAVQMRGAVAELSGEGRAVAKSAALF